MSSQTSQNLVSSFQIFASARIVGQPPRWQLQPLVGCDMLPFFAADVRFRTDSRMRAAQGERP
jgi:hypothetical protein